MVKVLFVCLGNICRSPMAEFVFKDMVNKKGLTDLFYIDSKATTDYNELHQEGIYQETKDVLNEMKIPFTEHMSKQLKKEDYDKFDYIIGMEQENVKNILNIIKSDSEHKVYKLLDFTDEPRDIVDPWYYHNFDATYYDIDYGCQKFLDYIIKKENL
ncbi:MAG: low molecular weight phosphotyrosine protein phosphatase [Firmicutes bacterium]|nr:low molecular weight phosphotyrosine protein phosphatase [Bacillota bacterium]